MHDATFENSTTGEGEPGFREYVGLSKRSVGVSTVFTCPVLQKSYPITQYAESRNYIINRYATIEYRARKYEKFVTVPSPATMAYLMDGRIEKKDANGYSFQVSIVPSEKHELLFPHNGLNHVAFLDGHVEALSRAQILAISDDDGFWTGKPN